jgi:GT2 family glycosyltransferase
MGNDALTIAIPTYNRPAIVVETVRRLLGLEPPASAIIVVDQTAAATPELARWHEEGTIRWVRLAKPSIPHAMNTALLTATTPLVLFLDDDVEPSPGIVKAHHEAHRDPEVWAVVGQILEQGESSVHHAEPADDLDFRFNHDTGRFVTNVMAGNLSVKRNRAVGVGGFDENFVGVAYRFETDFARRLVAAGGRVRFEPEATLRHLKLATGGLRTYGDHRTSASPMHSVGDYYFAIAGGEPLLAYVLRRLRKNVLTRFHAMHPWTIPAKLTGELRGLVLARRLARNGRKLLR